MLADWHWDGFTLGLIDLVTRIVRGARRYKPSTRA